MGISADIFLGIGFAPSVQNVHQPHIESRKEQERTAYVRKHMYAALYACLQWLCCQERYMATMFRCDPYTHLHVASHYVSSGELRAPISLGVHRRV
jgi:hypothetical protein